MPTAQPVFAAHRLRIKAQRLAVLTCPITEFDDAPDDFIFRFVVGPLPRNYVDRLNTLAVGAVNH